MKDGRVLRLFSLIFLIIGAAAAAARAGQLVTPEMKQRARQAVAQEKQLAGITKPRSVAVLPFQNLSRQTELDPLQKGLAVMLISDLAKLDVVTIIERTELQALIEELGFGQSGLVEAASAPRVGRLLQAEYLISGAFSSAPAGRLSINADVLKTASGQRTGRAQAHGAIEQLVEAEKQLLHQVVNALQLNLTPGQRAALDRPLSRNPAALMDFFRALDAGDRGRLDQARQLYAGALARDPDLSAAQAALAELGGPSAGPTVAAITAAQESSKSDPQSLEPRKLLLRAMRERTSFTTQLAPALPVARLRAPFVEYPSNRATPPPYVYVPPPGAY